MYKRQDRNDDNPGRGAGAVYLFNLMDASGNVTTDPDSFAAVRLQGRVGDYSGGVNNTEYKDINLGTSFDTTGTGPAANRTGASVAAGGIENADQSRNEGDAGFLVGLSEGADGSTRLAIGLRKHDGLEGSVADRDEDDKGAVLLFTFNDAANKDFSGGQLAAVIGDGYDNDYDCLLYTSPSPRD